MPLKHDTNLIIFQGEDMQSSTSEFAWGTAFSHLTLGRCGKA